MKLPKAIEILELAKDDPASIDPNDLFVAEDLAIEALRHIKDFRPTVNGELLYLLPGEDE